ncbi:hypothetical protein BJV82DRAFT_582637 [Fennellomyces sp. T-0311]|nr:hypothetical protein BJV82DRAFT_582637 [Fennellomyces sp. T-0311]
MVEDRQYCVTASISLFARKNYKLDGKYLYSRCIIDCIVSVFVSGCGIKKLNPCPRLISKERIALITMMVITPILRFCSVWQENRGYGEAGSSTGELANNVGGSVAELFAGVIRHEELQAHWPYPMAPEKLDADIIRIQAKPVKRRCMN